MKRFAVLAEDRSDAETLVVLVRRISCDPHLPIHKKGFSSCGELCRKAGSHIRDFAKDGATHFIICHDSDGNDPDVIKQKVFGSVARKVDLIGLNHVIIVPVQEIEAWIIADELAITAAIPSLVVPPVPLPESINSPKEWLERQSRSGGRSRPLYAHATWNMKVADHLDIQKVEKKCPSFRELTKYIRDES